MRLFLLAVALFAASPSPAATVTLSGGRGACPYGAIATDAAGNFTVTCAGTVAPVVPGGGPPAPPPVVVTPPAPPVVADDPCANLPPSTRVYCRSTPAPAPGAPIAPPQTAGNADFELVAPGGHPIRNAGGDKTFNMPAVRAGETIEVSVQGGFGGDDNAVTVTIRDPFGAVMTNNRNGITGPERLASGYGIIVFVAPTSGNYTVEMHGGGSLTTLNHFRR